MSQVSQDEFDATSIRCRDVTVAFDHQSIAVDRVNLDVRRGEIVSLIGPSGCGKTTLLRALAGLQSLASGEVRLSPPAITSEGQIGFVFQQPALLPWATTLQNVMLPLELIGHTNRDDRRLAAIESLHAVKLADAHEKRPHELSGGMQMRASIARALVTNPSILLLDEPFAALDDMLRSDLGRLLLDLWERRRFTAVMVTHNIGESILLSHRIAVMRRGVIETVVENPLAWPRSPSQMRTPEFAAFYGEMADALRGRENESSILSDGGAD
ncbi:MAG: ABC transporter ATP-binding protein [Planctomycetales bacterium]|nr:ABC transporter ATP-binding protein [Planctomycetales bacterium]